MFSTLRNRFGIPGVISVIALVFAMIGGAYAASNNGGGKATASKKAKKGPRGPKGATGPAGPAGAQGPAGANGKDGNNGQNGADGEDGDDGKSVQTDNATVGNCPDGGATVQVVGEPATLKNICNGADGEDGTDGSPWTAGGTLPPGATQTGGWGGVIPAEYLYLPISFPIPLSEQIEPTEIKVMKAGEGPKAGCEDASHTGTASADNPEAQPGFLCIYVGFGAASIQPEVYELGGGGIGASRSGAALFQEGAGGTSMGGSFAVTGCGTGFPCP